MPGIGDQNRVDRRVSHRNVGRIGLVETGSRVVSPENREHPLIGLDGIDLDAPRDQELRELSCTRAHICDASRGRRCEPVHSRCRVRRPPPVILLGDLAEGGRPCSYVRGRTLVMLG